MDQSSTTAAELSFSLILEARLDSLVGRPSGLIETLPKPVQKRIKYLKVLQEEFDEREEEYEKELDELDKKYAAIYGEHWVLLALSSSAASTTPDHLLFYSANICKASRDCERRCRGPSRHCSGQYRGSR